MDTARYHHGALADALVEEALAMARRGGLHAVTLRGAARRLGVSHAAAYRHFPNRRALLAHVATRAMRGLAEAVERCGTQGDPLERILSLSRAYVAFSRRDPEGFRAAFSGELWEKEALPDLRAAADRASEPLVAAVVQYCGDGASAEEIRVFAVALWSYLHGVTVLAMDGQLTQGRLSVEERPGQDKDLLLERGLLALIGGWSGAAQ